MSLSSIIKIAIVGESAGITEAVHIATEDLDKLEAKSKTTGAKVTSFANKFTAALGAGALVLAGVSIKAGDELNDSQDKLKRAIENTGGSWEKESKAVNAAAKAGEKYGYTAKDTFDALQQGTIATGSASKALGLLKTAQNLAAQTGKPLGEAMIAVAKASEGQIKPLKQLGIDLPVASGGAEKLKKAMLALETAQISHAQVQSKVSSGQLKGVAAMRALQTSNQSLKTAMINYNDVAKSGGSIMDALNKRLNGVADEGAKSLEGKTKELHAKFTDMTAHLGQKLIPIVVEVGEKFAGLVDFFSKNQAALVALIAVVGTFTAAMAITSLLGAVSAAISAVTGEEVALNLAFAVSPWGLVIEGAIGLAVGLKLLYDHFGPVHTAVDALWGIIQAAFGWIKDHWPLLLVILTGPIGLAIVLITKNFSTVKAVVLSAIGYIRDVWGIVGPVLEAPFKIAVGVIQGAFTLIKGAASGMVSGLKTVFSGALAILRAPFEALFNGVRSLWNDTIGGFHIPGIPFTSFHGFTIPRLHTGGVFNSGNGEGLALLKDGEAVFTPAQLGALAAAGVGGTTINNFPSGLSPAQTVALGRRYNRRNGRA